MENNLRFEKLTLNDNADIRVYEDALNFVFDSPDIKNVAISGAYGAGKSSVLASYKKKHSEKKYIHVSLAHFKDEANDNKPEEYVLERKILNQLIHQIDPKAIEQTNFKIKRNITWKSIAVTTLLIVIFALCVCFISFHKQWCGFLPNLSEKLFKALKFTMSHNVVFVVGFLGVGLASFFISQIVRLQKNKKFLKKVNVQGNEIELFDDRDDSYFDKYLNEVLYLFENLGADVVVFEDMDRFEMNHIFERLREVNTLANIQLKNKVIRFFYLLRDDVFISKDRTKFFDYIIPIVPVVDGTNS